MLAKYFDRIAVVHLPERVDRYRQLQSELHRIGIDIESPLIRIPYAPSQKRPMASLLKAYTAAS